MAKGAESIGGAVRGAGIQAGKGLANVAKGVGGGLQAVGLKGAGAAVAGGGAAAGAAIVAPAALAAAGIVAAAYVYKRWQHYQEAYLKKDIMINKQLSEMRVLSATRGDISTNTGRTNAKIG